MIFNDAPTGTSDLRLVKESFEGVGEGSPPEINTMLNVPDEGTMLEIRVDYEWLIFSGSLTLTPPGFASRGEAGGDMVDVSWDKRDKYLRVEVVYQPPPAPEQQPQKSGGGINSRDDEEGAEIPPELSIEGYYTYSIS